MLKDFYNIRVICKIHKETISKVLKNMIEIIIVVNSASFVNISNINEDYFRLKYPATYNKRVLRM